MYFRLSEIGLPSKIAKVSTFIFVSRGYLKSIDCRYVYYINLAHIFTFKSQNVQYAHITMSIMTVDDNSAQEILYQVS